MLRLLEVTLNILKLDNNFDKMISLTRMSRLYIGKIDFPNIIFYNLRISMID